MIKQISRNGWGNRITARSTTYDRCNCAQRDADCRQWKLDRKLPDFIRAVAEGEVSWQAMESLSSTLPDEQERTMLRLNKAAETGDEQAFLKAVSKIEWEGQTARRLVSIIRLALRAGAYLAARDIAEKGLKYHGEDTRVAEYARLLAPAKIISSSTAPNGQQRRANREWLSAHGDQYSGQWVAVRNGELIGNADSLEVLIEQIGNTEGVLLTTL